MTGMIIALTYCILECFTLRIKVMAFKATINFLGMKQIRLQCTGFLRNYNTIKRRSLFQLPDLYHGNPGRFLVPH